MRHLRILLKIMKMSLVREMGHRVHFFLSTLGGIFGMILTFIVPLVVVEKSGLIAGEWTRENMIVLISIFNFINAVDLSFFHSLNRLPRRIGMGDLDAVLRKPVSSRFSASIDFFNWDYIPNMIISIIVLGFGLNSIGVQTDFVQIVGFIIALLAGAILFYSLHFMIMILSIWFINAHNLAALFHVVRRSASYPTEIFGRVLFLLFASLIPIAFVATFPARVILDNNLILVFGIVFLSIIFWVISQKVWKFALKSYSSASS